jgi:phage tail tape-measure protein
LAAAGFSRSEYGTFYVAPPGQHDIFPIGGDAYRDAGTEDSAKGAATGAAIGGAAGLAAGAAAAIAVPIAGIAIALAGTGVGAYVGSLMGAMSSTKEVDTDESTRAEPVEPQGGVRIAINVERPGTEAQARDILRRSGAEHIVEADGEWHDRQWKDFDPRVPPESGS